MVKKFVSRTFLQQNLRNIYDHLQQHEKRDKGDSLEMRVELLRIRSIRNYLTRDLQAHKLHVQDGGFP